MPIYAYECPFCKNKEELLVPMSERENQVCSTCAHPLTQVLTSTMLNVETVPGYGKRYTS